MVIYKDYEATLGLTPRHNMKDKNLDPKTVVNMGQSHIKIKYLYRESLESNIEKWKQIIGWSGRLLSDFKIF